MPSYLMRSIVDGNDQQTNRTIVNKRQPALVGIMLTSYFLFNVSGFDLTILGVVNLLPYSRKYSDKKIHHNSQGHSAKPWA